MVRGQLTPTRPARAEIGQDAGEVIYVASVHIDDASGVTFSTGSVTVTGT